MIRSLKIGSSVVLTLAVATGCSQSSQPANSTQGSSVKKGSIVFAQNVPITSLDTAGMQPQGYPSGYEAAFDIYDGLVKFDDSLNFKPDLADKWSTSPDGLTWTFELKKNVKFQDGTPFNADAVVKDFTRMLDKNSNVGAYSLWDPISKVEKKDDYTVQIITKYPDGGLLNVLAHGSALIPSPTAVEKYGKDFSLHPVGTGPYSVQNFQPGSQLVLQANDQYFGGKPSYKQITFKYVSDPSSRIAALKSGQADVIDAVPVEMANDIKSDPTIDLINKPGLQVFGIGLNQTNQILKDKTVRQALNFAIQKDAIVNVLFKGYATVLDSPLAPNTTGYVKSGDYQYNANKAKQLLMDDGWKPGADGILEKNGAKMSFKLRTPDGMYPNDVMVAETIQNQLKTIGVDVKIDKVEKSTFWNSIKVPENKVDFDMVLFGYNPSHGDGYIQLDSLFGSNTDATQSPRLWNFNWYSNNQVNQLLDSAQKQVDLQKRTEQLGQAEKMIWDDAPYIWLYAQNNLSAKKKNIDGVHVLPVVFTIVGR